MLPQPCSCSDFASFSAPSFYLAVCIFCCFFSALLCVRLSQNAVDISLAATAWPESESESESDLEIWQGVVGIAATRMLPISAVKLS